jgi:predicted house-cleaning NTP pyrophosphatase (Maf/HAM1 superfamily)
MVSEVEKMIVDINNSIAKWYENKTENPKHLVLTIAQRQAIKIAARFEGYQKITSYLDIPIINAEETLIVGD